MKILIYIFLFALAFIAAPPPSPAATTNNLVYIIPVKDMIERGLVYVIRRGVHEAVKEGASTLILDMDTPGGRVDAAEDIVEMVASLKIRTCTFVNPNAISAGAIISLATDEIYMAPGSRIGDAMPLLMNPVGGGPQEMPSAIEEKMVSFVAGFIRSTAQRKNHDPKLAEAMVRRGPEYRIEDEVICPSNQLLTLTNVEAERLVGKEGSKRPLLSKGTVQNIDELLVRLGHQHARVVRLNVTIEERIARYIEMFSSLFLMAGLLGLYIEFKTPGAVLPGIIGVLLLAVWFWGYHIAGLAGMWEILMFMIGLLLLMAEVFLFPGTVLPGLIGSTLILASLLMAMAGHYPGIPWQPNFRRIPGAISNLSISLVGTFILGWALARFLPENRTFQKLMLMVSENKTDGFHASTGENNSLLGREGLAVSDLRPGGIALIGEQKIDVVSRGEFIEKGTRIIIAEIHGNRIVADRITQEPTHV